jgi:DNA-binding IclR family transcriptional regulator
MADGPGARRTGRIQSLERMDAILGAIASAPDGSARLSEIAAGTGLHKNTAFSLLKTLVALGYCDQARDSQAYRIGRRAFEIARIAESSFDIVTAVRPFMLRLAFQHRESLSLAVPGQEGCVVLATVEGSYGVRGARFQGQQAPYHASALGKAVMAFLPEEERDQILQRICFEKHTRRTLITPTELLAECAHIRERGFAVSIAEEEIGASAVAAPLFTRAGQVAGALALWGPTVRLTRPRLAEFGSRLVSEARAAMA